MRRTDLLLTAALLAAGVLDVLAGPADGRAARAVALAGTLPLAVRRTHPIPALAAATAATVLQATAGLFDDHPAVPLLVLLVALYSTGRYAPARSAAAATILAAAAITVARLATADATAPDAIVTFAAALLPVLVGGWARNQEHLRRELGAKAERLERARKRDAEAAAEEERMRIAADLETAATGSLHAIARDTAAAQRLIDADDRAQARETLERVAGTARQALADVRRVLGVLRRDAPATDDAPDRHDGNECHEGSRAWGPADLPDWALPAALALAAAVEGTARFGSAGALSALVAAPLLVRAAHPLAAAAGVLAAIAAQSAAFDPGSMPATAILAIVAASYTLGRRQPHTAALVAFAAGAVLHAALVHPDAIPQALLGGTIVPWTLGRVRRAQQRLAHETAERAAQIERDREREARAAVTAERMRVARELHDAVAHNISVIAIQAAGAHGIVDRDPGRAKQVTSLIQDVTQEALVELGRIADDQDRDDHNGLDAVDQLAERARQAGLPVDVTIEGDPVPLPKGLDLAAYRIVQEALANTSKHAGPAHAHVTISYEPTAIALTIDDDGRGPTAADKGHGLAGMRERVQLYGGTLHAGPGIPAGFTIRARLPL